MYGGTVGLYGQTEVEGARERFAVRENGELKMLRRLSDCRLGPCVEWCTDRGRTAVRRNGGLNRGSSCAVMWVFLHQSASSFELQDLCTNRRIFSRKILRISRQEF